MLTDFMHDIGGLSQGPTVIDSLFRSAECFARMWERCDAQKDKV